MKYIFRFLATLAYSGFFPFAPGTFGTLIALVVYLFTPEWLVNDHFFWTIPLLLVVPSVCICSKAEESMTRDDRRIVLDEFNGYFFAVLFLPKSLIIAVLAFVLFRLFDIFKPEPVNILQKLPKGWGIVMDDIMAGIYANLCLQIIYFVFIAP